MVILTSSYMFSNEAASTSPEAIVHDRGESPMHLHSVKVANVVQQLLTTSRTFVVKESTTLQEVEQSLGMYFGQNLTSLKHLIGQEIQFNGTHIILQSGTSFPVRAAANDEKYALAA